jgi:folate-binding protein YgfZ
MDPARLENARPSVADRLDAARDGAAVGPALVRGVLRFSGTKRLDFLNRMSSQKLAGIAPGAAIHAAFLDGRGRVVGEGMVVVGEDDVLLDVDPAAAPALKSHLAKYVLRDDVKIADPDPELRVVPVLGPRGAELARRAAALRSWPNARRGAVAQDLLVRAADADDVRRALVEAGAVALDEGDLEILRVEAGVPRWGAEIDDARLVMEAALTGSAVSFDKGCYLGQEIVLRGTFRGQIQRGLVQLELPAGAGPGAKLRADEQEVGVVTSAADAPGGRVGLGYLRRAQWAPGTRLATEGGEAVVRRVLVVEKD